MKVKNLIATLQDYEPDAEIIVLWWDKPEESLEGDNLSDENWHKICTEFDEWGEAGADISEWIATAISEYSTEE